MTIVFDGKAFANKKEEEIKKSVLLLKIEGTTPRLASIIVGDNPASKLYVGLKKMAAERVGAELDVYFMPESVKIEEILFLIETLNNDDLVHGIMIQLPLPGALEESRDKIIFAIKPNKDVDGLQEESYFLHPTSKAVIQILGEAKRELKANFKTVCVVGATGMVGAPLVRELKKEGYVVIECNQKTQDLGRETLKADVLISATGTWGLIKGEMVKDNAVVIDVGSPKSDVNFYEVSEKAAFITPVPGGVGPVTITCLLENLVSAC